jgi:hypothetical protein
LNGRRIDTNVNEAFFWTRHALAGGTIRRTLCACHGVAF